MEIQEIPKKKNVSFELQGDDRISALPDSLIHVILSFLPSTKDAVRTGILSKRWRLQWTHVQNLIFEFNSDDGNDNCESFARFVDSSIALNSCSSIDKFILQIHSTNDEFLNGKVPMWIDFAKRKQAKLITLDFSRDCIQYILPSSVFINNSVVEMQVACCGFESFHFVDWKSLKNLGVHECELSNEVLEIILSGTPSLESFELYDCYGYDRLHFGSNSCKRLVLSEITWKDEAVDSLDISSPHLKTFELLSELYDQWPKLDLPSLIGATLDFEIQCDSTVSELAEFIQGLLCQVQHAQELKLGAWCLKVLSTMEVTGIVSPLFGSNCVAVNAPCFDKVLPGIAILLRSLPELEELTIKVDGISWQFDFPAELGNFNVVVNKYWLAYKTSSRPLLHLKTVEIRDLHADYEGYELVLEFIECLLKNAIVLNHMIIDYSTEFNSEFSEKLMSMPRSSPDAVIKFK